RIPDIVDDQGPTLPVKRLECVCSVFLVHNLLLTPERRLRSVRIKAKREADVDQSVSGQYQGKDAKHDQQAAGNLKPVNMLLEDKDGRGEGEEHFDLRQGLDHRGRLQRHSREPTE